MRGRRSILQIRSFRLCSALALFGLLCINLFSTTLTNAIVPSDVSPFILQTGDLEGWTVFDPTYDLAYFGYANLTAEFAYAHQELHKNGEEEEIISLGIYLAPTAQDALTLFLLFYKGDYAYPLSLQYADNASRSTAGGRILSVIRDDVVCRAVSSAFAEDAAKFALEQVCLKRTNQSNPTKSKGASWPILPSLLALGGIFSHSFLRKTQRCILRYKT